MNSLAAIVLFGGPGGVCTGLRDAGVSRSVSVEYEDSAVATARAAGHTVFQADVSLVDPRMIVRHYGLAAATLRLLLQSSPPCQGLSPAGKGKGREDIELLFRALTAIAKHAPIDAAGPIAQWMHYLDTQCSDERSPLTFETIRWIARLTPEYVMLEQVPTALPIWQKFAEVLTAWGYSVWCGNVQAEQFGVPQTRKRAILLASRVSEVSAPVPTHSKYHSRSPEKLDEGVEKWVSMAEALGWGAGYMVSNYGSGGDPAGKGTAYWLQDSSLWRADVEGVSIEEYDQRVNGPLPAVEGDVSRTHRRPSPTIVGSFAPEVVAAPGYRKAGDPPRQKTPGSVRVTHQQAAVLQSFPWDYPWQGNKGKVYQQIGNAVPPLLAQRLVEGLCKSESPSVTETPEVAA